MVLLWSVPALAQIDDHAPSPADLKKLSIEQLMNVQVTSVSRTEEKLAGAAAALSVVSNEDLRRSGASSVAEALRLLPGIHVGRQSASTWAISSRGFSSTNSGKLLVLSDTRSVYTPLVSGVQWEVQNYLLQDIDRIEVIRGPGATLWGSNAVNGVINITTKSAAATQGLFVTTTTGTEDHALAGVRYGGTLGRAYYRVFAQYGNRGTSHFPADTSRDDWEMGHAGFRADWEHGNSDTFTLQGDLYRGELGQLVPAVVVIGRDGPTGRLRVQTAGGNILGRWRHRTAAGSDLQVRAYYDRTHRDDPSFLDDLDTVDVDVLHRSVVARRHELTWGANYHLTTNRNVGKGLFAVVPSESRDTLVGGFVQAELRPHDGLRFTAGTKVEHNDFSGVEIQPSARIAADLSARQTVWGSVSRAVRVPTRLERDVAIDVSPPGSEPRVRLLGNPSYDSERLVAYEAGYRWQIARPLFVDVAVFHNRYAGLSSVEIGQPFAEGGGVVVPVINENLTDGHAQGVETLVSITPVPWWRGTVSSSYFSMDLEAHGLDGNRGAWAEDSTPRHQLGVRSYLDLPRAFQLDAMFRHLTAIRRLPQIISGEGLPGYAELDLRLAWRGLDNIELSMLGQNLLHARHIEFGEPDRRGELERAVSLRATWGF